MAEPAHSDLLLRSRWLVPVAVLVVLFHLSPIAEALNHAFFDAISRHPFREPPLPEKSALVVVDQGTMETMSRQGVRWPFSRKIFAQMILGLHAAGAERIAVDITFFERSDDPNFDELLARVCAAAPSVVLARTPERAPILWDSDFIKANPDFFREPRMGMVDYPADSDGVARHYRLAGSLAAVVARSPSEKVELLRWYGGLHQTDDTHSSRLAALGVPVLSASRFILLGNPILEHITETAPDMDVPALAKALAAEPRLTGVEADYIRGRTVFIGGTASGTFDFKPLPIGNAEPGALIHWTAWANLITDSFIEPLGWWWIFGIGLLLGNAVLWVGINRTSIGPPLLAASAATVILFGGSWILTSLGWFLAPATPLVAVLFVLLGVVVENFWREQRRKREIQGMFGAYVDPGVVDRLVRNPGSIALRGERREATVFFSDLAGFTDLSEKLKDEPERMVEIVNAYLEETSECLHRHGAYVDKYIGDAVMAVLGAPQELPNHALAACRAALEARAAIDGINARYAGPVGVELEVRIGLNTGELIVGNLGSSRKKNYTVMGDTVNLASRLEGANKHFGTGILLGEETARRVQGVLLTRPLARLRVKGKLQAIEVHTLHGDPGNLAEAEKEFVAAYREGYTAYVERRFAAAVPPLSRALVLQPDDATTRRLHTEASAFAQSPPPSTWEPVISLDSK